MRPIRKALLLSAIAAALGAGGYLTFLFFNPECCATFDAERWRANCPDFENYECNRRRMVGDMVRKHMVLGANRNDIEKALGAPDMQRSDKRILCYGYVVDIKLADDLTYQVCYDSDHRLCAHGYDCRDCYGGFRSCTTAMKRR